MRNNLKTFPDHRSMKNDYFNCKQWKDDFEAELRERNNMNIIKGYGAMSDLGLILYDGHFYIKIKEILGE